MISYLINFVLCSGLLLSVYRVFLMGENLYKFNRFYLLFSLLFSLVVPFMTIAVPGKVMDYERRLMNPAVPQQQTLAPVPQHIPALPVQSETYTTVSSEGATQIIPVEIVKPVLQQTVPAETHNYLPDTLITLYLFAAAILLIRFIRNSYRISRSVSQSIVVNYHDTKLVLIDEEVTPHSFLKYIFINKKDYREGSIEPEIICHEQTHVRQLHSLDVILIELLQAICWFNPFIPLYRRAIQLNHEFLADQEVIKNYRDTSAYQYLVLAKSSQCGSLYLTSQFNYLTTKKRLIMMTKNTSAKIALLKQLAIVPVLAGVVILFSNKVIAQVKDANKATTAKKKGVLENGKLKPIAAARYDGPKDEPVIGRNFKEIPPAKHDAPQGVLDEYATLLKKDNLPAAAAGKTLIDFTLPNQQQLQALFNQMSKKQQDAQAVLFGPVLTPSAKRSPDAKRLTEWQDAAKYDVWIDGKRIKNSGLAKYKPADFNLYQFTKLKGNIESDKFNQVVLMTPAYYANDCKQVLADNYQMPVVRITSHKIAQNQSEEVGSDDNNKIISPAKVAAPQGVMDEYTAILKKYNTLPAGLTRESLKARKVHLNLRFTKADRQRLQALFDSMDAQQQNSEIIRFGVLVMPEPVRSPTEQQLKKWQQKLNYTVWIDEKWTKHSDLTKHKPTDFEYYDVCGFSKSAAKLDKTDGMIDLMTHDAYVKYYKEMIAMNYQKLLVVFPGEIAGEKNEF